MPECRICLEIDKVENFTCPCKCSGTIKYVHNECLYQWMAKSGRYKYCNICKSLYTISKPDNAESDADSVHPTSCHDICWNALFTCCII